MPNQQFKLIYFIKDVVFIISLIIFLQRLNKLIIMNNLKTFRNYRIVTKSKKKNCLILLDKL